MSFISPMIARTLVAAALMCGAGAHQAMAKCGGAITFAPGASGASVSAKVAGDAVCDYTISARKGQVLSVDLKAPSGIEAIAVGKVEHDFAAERTLTLPANGTYTVRVLQTRNAARKFTAPRAFTLSVGVRGGKAAASQPAAKAAAAATVTTATPTGATLCEQTTPLTADIGNYSGAIAGDGLCEYRFKGRAGQQLTMMMDGSSDLDVILFDPVNATLERDQAFTLPQDGTYTVRVLQNRNAARKATKAKPFSMVLNLD